MVENGPTPSAERREYRLVLVLFSAALIFHFWGAVAGWRSLNLPGCEFRQTQTAISAFFIQREHNFSLAYPTPVLGKPWSIPLEFPLYQWTVVAVSNRLGVSLTEAARAVSLVCFYFTLPALWGLLARIGLSRSMRLLTLGLVLTCPLYIVYARSFLIETMALMFGAWFLLGYVHAVEKRKVGWLIVGAIAGTGCGLVKVTTLFFFLMPAFLWTLYWFHCDWRSPGNSRFSTWVKRAGWCASVVIVPFAASIWWVKYTDAIKALSVAGNFLVSNRLTGYNFGTGVRFSPAIWSQHWEVLFLDLTSKFVLVASIVIAALFSRRWWALIAILAGLFLAVQAVFPILYAWHEYYYVASAFTLMAAYGLALSGVFESKLPRIAVWAIALVIYGAQARGYLVDFYPGQKMISNGGSNLTLALRRVMAPDEVMISAGDDWSSITPYYAQRRAYMIRRNLETTWDEIEPAFAQLDGEDVTALVLYDDQIKNAGLIDRAVRAFHLDPRPAFRWRNATVLLHQQIRATALTVLRDTPEIELLVRATDVSSPLLKREVPMSEVLRRYSADFDDMSPRPFKFYTTYGTDRFDFDGKKVFNAHPDTRLWFKLPAGKHVFSVEVGIVPAAYDEKLPVGERSDGVRVQLSSEDNQGAHLLFSQAVNPRDEAADRGMRRIEHAFELEREGVVVVTVDPGPHGNYARDWTMLGRIEIK